ncbi:hypothetical protein K466DRAFT_595901 [Polyporus arcularius HHB13444]|uniref:Uncharacterized protein n=1 Tax=Polyporus arcularius HHB13444 TaxID=1314778 RepID=A0A5C3PQI2_9APHY|nr:hypothetical protein K466DRAFT_595901 [Polyporus arcularius HHB13444]
MPTLTSQSDALFDFEVVNDTKADVTIHILRANGMRAGSVALPAGQTTPLGLEAGSIYRYAVEKNSRTMELSVSIWRNATCHVSAIFEMSPRQCGCTQYIQLAAGVKITATECVHHNAQVRNATDPCHDPRWAGYG